MFVSVKGMFAQPPVVKRPMPVPPTPEAGMATSMELLLPDRTAERSGQRGDDVAAAVLVLEGVEAGVPVRLLEGLAPSEIVADGETESEAERVAEAVAEGENMTPDRVTKSMLSTPAGA